MTLKEKKIQGFQWTKQGKNSAVSLARKPSFPFCAVCHGTVRHCLRPFSHRGLPETVRKQLYSKVVNFYYGPLLLTSKINGSG